MAVLYPYVLRLEPLIPTTSVEIGQHGFSPILAQKESLLLLLDDVAPPLYMPPYAELEGPLYTGTVGVAMLDARSTADITV